MTIFTPTWEQTVETLATPGTETWVCTLRVTSVTVECELNIVRKMCTPEQKDCI